MTLRIPLPWHGVIWFARFKRCLGAVLPLRPLCKTEQQHPDEGHKLCQFGPMPITLIRFGRSPHSDTYDEIIGQRQEVTAGHRGDDLIGDQQKQEQEAGDQIDDHAAYDGPVPEHNVKRQIPEPDSTDKVEACGSRLFCSHVLHQYICAKFSARNLVRATGPTRCFLLAL